MFANRTGQRAKGLLYICTVLRFYRSFFLQLTIALMLFTACRILFFLYNYRLVADECHFTSFIVGLRYDAAAIAFLYGPYLITSVWRFVRPASDGARKLCFWWFLLGSSTAIVLNCIDFAYFGFVMKRSTADLWSLAGTGTDLGNLAPTFVKYYWHILLIAVCLFAAVFKLYGKTDMAAQKESKRPSLMHTLLFAFLLVVVSVTAARGGLQMRPLDIISAVENGHFREAAVQLNTPFTMMKSLGKRSLERKYWFKDNRGNRYFDPVSQGTHNSEEKPNVVIIILESFSKEYVGGYNKGKGYTPFLDSLMAHSLVANRAYANGMKSIEGIPAIVASIPTFQDEPFITSRYSANVIEALPSILDKMGYETAFFHGGNNGTMAFDRFAKAAGFNHYYGRDEYRGPDAYDGRWGIRDEEFLNFTVSSLSQIKEPFMGTVFTLSSHHPFEVPPPYDKRYNDGKKPIHNVVRYSDHALQHFFRKAALTHWYKNSVFILTADHCGPSFEPEYRTRTGRYAIPLIIFSPNGTFKGSVERTTQQCDIMPTVLDIVGYGGNYFSFGQSLLRKNEGFAFSRLDHMYQLITDDMVLLHDGRHLRGLYYLKNDPEEKKDLIGHLPDSLRAEVAHSQLRLMAIIQSLNNGMLDNLLQAP